ncbi:hypothetical protein TIFTF001_033883 [Ficus carica]|uniref:Uncharacterized protein n=1 Tax=Ficus carica TaxID=3494 RepID=A0AA88J9Y6_FICCA|nr:hypothetical protein TIFTF001_033883 [Ficus carica]
MVVLNLKGSALPTFLTHKAASFDPLNHPLDQPPGHQSRPYWPICLLAFAPPLGPQFSATSRCLSHMVLFLRPLAVVHPHWPLILAFGQPNAPNRVI